MYDGFHVIDFVGHEPTSPILRASFRPVNGADPAATALSPSAAALCYGCTWLHNSPSQSMVATCSFYNHEMQIWQVDGDSMSPKPFATT
jgi:hypothetical protein